MKKLYVIILLAFPLLSVAQSTPATGESIISTHFESLDNRDFGDTINFNELSSGTIVSTQYTSSHGAIFSGWPQGNYCDTYDYGLPGWGSILKSSTWYDGIRIDFVNPNDTSEVMPVCVFGFNNPIDTEIDYIVVRFYDINDNLIHTHHSVSPELVNINLGSSGAAYVTMEDEFDSAYVVDDLWFEAGCPASVKENTFSELLVYPNPVEGILTVNPENTWIESLSIYDIAGRKVKQFSVNSSMLFQLDIADLNAGVYVIKDEKNHHTAMITKH